MPASCTVRPYGTLHSGLTIDVWTLVGAAGMKLEFLTYGGIVTRLFVPDRHGKLGDIVLGLNSLDEYASRHPYFGAITGRVAGRITNSRFELEGKKYELVRNDPPNHIHGGTEGFDRKIWNAVPAYRSDDAPSVRLTYRSPDGEEGYPGNLTVAVTYSVTADNTFIIETETSTDKPTPVNLTHHSYFNLAGEAAAWIDDHVLQIFSDEAAVTDEKNTLLGRLAAVAGKPNDFKRPRRLGDVIDQLHLKHGDAYQIRRKPGSRDLVTAAYISEPTSGRAMEVLTTEQYLQLYTGVSLDGKFTGKSGRPYHAHAAFCLEAEGYPDAANCPGMGDIILRPGAPVTHLTHYAFSTS
jgi:aldose 1-epimerase